MNWANWPELVASDGQPQEGHPFIFVIIGQARLLKETNSKISVVRHSKVIKESACQCRRSKRHRFNPWLGKIPWSRKWQPTPVFLPGKFHGQRSLVGYNLRGCKELDTTEHASHPNTFFKPEIWDKLKMTSIYKVSTMCPKWKKVKFLNSVWLFETPWTVAYQAPSSMGFSRQKYWIGLPFPSPADLPDPGIEPGSSALQADALTSEPPGKPQSIQDYSIYFILIIPFLHIKKLKLQEVKWLKSEN